MNYRRKSLHLNLISLICEPTSLIGTGTISDDDYILKTNEAVKSVSEDILILQAAGVSSGDDVYKVVMGGAHGSGGTKWNS